MQDEPAAQKPPRDPVRRWTFIILGISAVLLAWHLVADRITPYSTQARINALVVPIASEVSGTVTDVRVDNNEFVEEGQPLFQVDRERYALTVDAARADLETARQSVGAATANVDAARANLGSVEASALRAEQDATRQRRIKEEDPGAISDRRLEMADASLAASIGQVAAAEANLESALQNLGETGDQNARVMQARAALKTAELNLDRSTVRAPDAGLVTDVRVDAGNYAAAGAPLMTFIALHNIWVQADLTENNLGLIEIGNDVDIVFDVLPGRVYRGRVRSTGFGVSVATAPLGSLPTVENDRSWLRDAQRFPVIIDFDLESTEDKLAMRVGAQASVRVYTGEHALFNFVGRVLMRLASIVSYAY
jgi:multidrug resistance efflux pump